MLSISPPPLLWNTPTVFIIIFIILDLDSTFEQKHAIYGFLSLAYFTQNDDLQSHLLSCKWHHFILPMAVSLSIHLLMGTWADSIA
jgi:hypothetical protein